MAKRITEAEFDTLVLQAEKPVLVDFLFRHLYSL